MKKITVAQLKEALGRFDDTLEVQVAIEQDGDTLYGNVTLSRIAVNFGLAIIGSVNEDEEEEEDDENEEEETP